MSKSNAVDQPKTLSKNLFPVVGIGASAGGLSAFKRFIKTIAGNSGMAYILVQHLHPEHESALPEILQKETKIPVVEITDKVHVEPDHIYTIPSNKLLVANDGMLKLSPRSAKDDPNKPIDLFFSSLAEVHQSHAIGVVLSGTGADGTAGLKDIKDQGGLTFAQDPASADYDGMPQSAIDAETVDFVLPPESIPHRLMELKESFKLFSSGEDSTATEPTDKEGLRKILALLRVRKGIDFTLYKQTTIRRRIIRRMVMLKLEKIADYVDYLKKNKPEQDLLFQDMLIPVTSFFRDPKIFDTLCEKVLPSLIKNKSTYSPLRIWVAGCSTGQEAYSIAMCIHEYLSDHVSTIKVQIFASDISEKAVAKARTGLYLKKELEEISANRLLQFFNKKDGHYQVKKSIRDMCVFACHNLLKDPPFARMDLISCRNVLIYLEPFLQKKALTTFHYALNEKGILWLGKSETTGSASDLFIASDKKDKLYTRKSGSGRYMTVVSERNETAFKEKNDAFQNQEGKTDDFQKSADAVVLSKYTPVGVIVNEQFDIVQFRGSTREYLEPSPGKASLNVLKMAREGLSFEIRNALQKSKISGEPFIKEGIPANKGKNLVTIEIIPLPDTLEPYYLILFRDTSPLPVHNIVSETDDPSSEKIKRSPEYLRIQQLEKELAQNRENMRGITEEQEAANEELQSANEELLSSSEELQSLNEELETSKEELQSTNEELMTLNQELHDSNEESEQNRRFADATLATLHEPLLVIGKNYRIINANESFYKVFQISEEETVGKGLFELQNKSWEIPGLRKELSKIRKEKEQIVELEVTHTFSSIGERTICINIKPIYRENGEQMILLAVDDITPRKQAEQIIKDKAAGILKERQMLHNFFMQTPAMLCILTGPKHTFEFANEPYCQLIGNRNPVGKTLKEVLPELEGQGFPEILDKVYQTGEPYIGKEMPASLLRGGKTDQVFLNFNYEPIKDEQGKTEGILVFAYDVTEQIIARNKIKESESKYRGLIEGLPIAVYTCDAEGYLKLYNEAGVQLWGHKPELGKDQWCGSWKIFTTEGKPLPLEECPMAIVLKEGRIVHTEIVIQRPDGSKRHVIPYPQPEYDSNGKIIGAVNTLIDITDQVEARQKIEASEKRYEMMVMQSPFGFAVLKGKDMVVTLANDSVKEMWGKGKDIEGKPLISILPEIKNTDFPELLDQVYTTGIPYYAYESPVQLVRNGKMEEVYFNFVYQPYHEANETISGITIIAIEVTPQAELSKKLKESESAFRQMAELMPAKITNIDEAGNAYYFNQLWLDYTGLSIEELKGNQWEKVRHPDELEEIKRLWSQSLETGNDFEMEQLFLNKNGKYRWHLTRAVAVKDDNGKVKKRIGVSIDIHEQKMIEQKKDDFISIASHEMKTPLATTKAYLQLVEEFVETDNEKINLYVKKAGASIEKLNGLISDLLDVSKINNGKLNYNFSTFNFNEMLDSAIEAVQYTSINHTVIKSGEIVEEVTGDKDRLQQVVINLLSNAVKYSPKAKKVFINIGKENNELKVSVKDEGIGLSKNNLEKIFERYYRVKDNHSAQFQGLGIGLYISFEIIQRHQGKLWAESKHGKGSTFYFTLPVSLPESNKTIT